MVRKIALYLLTFVLASHTLLAQTHEWAFDINSSAASIVSLRAQAVDDSGNVYIGGVYRDSLYLPGDTFYFASTSQVTLFVAKFTKDGNYVWGKSFTNVSSANVSRIVINTQNQILLFGNYIQASGSSISFGSYSLTKTASVFVAFLNSAGSFTYARDLGYGFFTTAFNITLGTDNTIHATYYLNGGSSWTINDSLNPQSGTGYVYVIAKYSSDAKSLIWQKNFSINDVSTFPALAVDRNNQVYFSFRAEANKTFFGTSTGSSRKLFVVWLRPDGSLKDKLVSGFTNQFASIDHLAVVDSNAIYFAGSTRGDSLEIANNTIKSLSTDPNKPFYFVGEIKGFNQINWSRSSSHFLTNPNTRMSINGDFLYFSSVFSSSGFSMGGFSTSTFVRSIVFKFDRLGNVLWYLPINSATAPLLTPVGEQDLLYAGGFNTQITLSPFTLTNNRSAAKPFVAKTFDYSITRGQIVSGPYCAGDTLFVPYIAAGTYDTSNVFSAELSDENGDFLGGQRALGSLKYNKDSVVLGKLPLFEVASSNRYRIRITSSAPTVQSYYQLDTLNLLIYSRDKADPGKDTSLCYGDTLQLNTFGGTRWQWTPNYAMSDSNVRNPFVYPLQDTVYTIIISDSSGCGAPDTADIKISIIQPPYFTALTQSDTVVCIGDSVDLSIEALAGIGQYYIYWMSPQGALLKTTNTISKDTFRLKIDSNTTVYALVTDSCSTRIDTATFLINTYSATQIIIQPADTQVCYGQEIILSNYLQHPKVDSITWAWYQKGSANLVSTDSFLNRSFLNNIEFRVIAKNGCTNEEIVHDFGVSVFTPLSANVINPAASDSFCVGTNQILYATLSGGNPNLSKWSKWLFGNDIIDSDSILLNFDSLYSLNPLQRNYDIKLVTSDGCTSPNDTASYNFYLNPKLSIDSIVGLDSILCLGASVQLSANTSGGKGTSFYGYEWSYKGNQVGGDNAFFSLISSDFKAGQVHTLQAKVTDGCSEPDSISVTFRIPDSLNTAIVFPFAEAEICNGKGQLFKSSSSGGIPQDYAYVWTINGKQVSDTDSFLFGGVEHRLTVDSIFQVTLSLADNCNLPIALDSVLIKIKPIPLLSLTGDSLSRNQRNDTTICRGNEVKLAPTIYYNYKNASQINWFLNGVYLQTSADFTFSADLQSDRISQYQISYYLADSCARKQDTSRFTIFLRDSLAVNVLTDTTVCFGSQLDLSATASGGLVSNHKVEWKSLIDNSLLGEGKVLSISNLVNNQQILVTLTDNCTVLSDSSIVTISVLAPLSVGLSSSGNCTDAAIILTTTASGGIDTAYNFKWFENGNLLSNSLDTLSVLPTKLASYKVVLSDNCSRLNAVDSVLIAPTPSFTVLNIEEEICEDYTPNWQVNSDNGDTYTYSVLEQNTSALFGLNNIPTYSAGDYSWTIFSENELGCIDSQVASTLVKPLPDPIFSWSPENPSYEQPEVTFLAQSDNDFYSWYLDDELVNASKAYTTTFNALGFYKVRLSVETNGCSDSFTKSIEFIDTYKWLEVTSFSPNSDGLNDVYKPYLTGISVVNFEIYNRWGQLVFQGNSSNSSWDGTYLGKAVPDGVYYVLLAVQDTKKQNYYYRSALRLVR